MEITQEILREMFSYCEKTGLFTWKIKPSKAVKIGDIAGCVEKRIGYNTIGIKGKVYKSHRLIWLYIYGEWPYGQIDHINGNKSDNRICNLRDVSQNGNAQNIKKPNARNKSGYLGVIRFQNKWRASITINSKTKWIGDYECPEEAHQAYLAEKRKIHSTCTI